MKILLLTAVALFGALPLLAGERSDAFVSAARKAYAADPMCRATIVTNFVVKGTPDDKAPGLVRWHDVEGVRNVRDIGGWTGLRAGRVFRGTQLNSKPNHKQYELTGRLKSCDPSPIGLFVLASSPYSAISPRRSRSDTMPISPRMTALPRSVNSYCL